MPPGSYVWKQDIEYQDGPNRRRLAAQLVDPVITAKIRPRIVLLGRIGGDSERLEFDAILGHGGGAAWRIYGGHRLRNRHLKYVCWHRLLALPPLLIEW